jgi:uncharacterized membrane protein YgdD (TMEM256/DUF423 family)
MIRSMRWLSAFAAVCCGISVGLGAYASHAASGQAKERIAIAALFALGHGLALLVLATRDSLAGRSARVVIAIGIILFSGSLASAAFFGTSTAAAPLGGSLLMLGWLVAAIDLLRKD